MTRMRRQRYCSANKQLSVTCTGPIKSWCVSPEFRTRLALQRLLLMSAGVTGGGLA